MSILLLFVNLQAMRPSHMSETERKHWIHGKCSMYNIYTYLKVRHKWPCIALSHTLTHTHWSVLGHAMFETMESFSHFPFTRIIIAESKVSLFFLTDHESEEAGEHETERENEQKRKTFRD